MNEIPLESAPPRSPPAFAPPPQAKPRGGRFEEHLRRADGPSPAKLRASRVKRSAPDAKEQPTASLAVLHANPQSPTPAIALPNQPNEAVPGAISLPVDPTIRFSAEPDATAPQSEVLTSATPVWPAVKHLSKVAVPLPAVQDASVERVEAAPQPIAPLPQAATPPAAVTSPSALILPTPLPEPATGEAQPEPEKSPLHRAPASSVDFADNLLKNLIHNAQLAIETIESPLLQVDESAPAAESSAAPADSIERPQSGEATPTPATAADGRNPRSSADGLMSRAPSPRGDAAGSTHHEVDRVRFVQRVSRAFQSLGNQEGHVRLRLSPSSLGAMTLEVTLRGGEMVARMETETAAAKSLLLDSLPALRERLSQHEVRIARFDVDLADHSGGSAGRHTQPEDLPRRRHVIPRETASPTAAVGPSQSPAITTGGLNVLI
jgi:flagellar hook-length control protein FliK